MGMDRYLEAQRGDEWRDEARNLRATLHRIARAFDQGTNANGWDLGIMEEVWEILKSVGLVTTCPVCKEERANVGGDECPFAEWHEAHWDDDEEDDEDVDDALGVL